MKWIDRFFSLFGRSAVGYFVGIWVFLILFLVLQYDPSRLPMQMARDNAGYSVYPLAIYPTAEIFVSLIVAFIEIIFVSFSQGAVLLALGIFKKEFIIKYNYTRAIVCGVTYNILNDYPQKAPNVESPRFIIIQAFCN